MQPFIRPSPPRVFGILLLSYSALVPSAPPVLGAVSNTIRLLLRNSRYRYRTVQRCLPAAFGYPTDSELYLQQDPTACGGRLHHSDIHNCRIPQAATTIINSLGIFLLDLA